MSGSNMGGVLPVTASDKINFIPVRPGAPANVDHYTSVALLAEAMNLQGPGTYDGQLLTWDALDQQQKWFSNSGFALGTNTLTVGGYPDVVPAISSTQPVIVPPLVGGPFYGSVTETNTGAANYTLDLVTGITSVSQLSQTYLLYGTDGGSLVIHPPPSSCLFNGFTFTLLSARAWTSTICTPLDGAATTGMPATLPANSTTTFTWAESVNTWVVSAASAASGITNIIAPMRVTSVANVDPTNPGTTTFDGVALSNGDRIGLVGQSDTTQNGPYVFHGSGSPLSRTTDNVIQGTYWLTTAGTTYANTGWFLTTPNPIILGSTPLTFVQFSGSSSYTAGNGLSLVGNSFSVDFAIAAALSSPTFTGTVTIPNLISGPITSSVNSLVISGLASTAGGSVTIKGGDSSSTFNGGAFTLSTGIGGSLHNGGILTLTTGAGGLAAGAIVIVPGNSSGTSTGATTTIKGGPSGNGATGDGGAISLVGGAAASTNGAGGAAGLTGGAGSGSSAGGNVVLTPGAGGATGQAGSISLAGVTKISNTVSLTGATPLLATATAGIVTANSLIVNVGTSTPRILSNGTITGYALEGNSTANTYTGTDVGLTNGMRYQHVFYQYGGAGSAGDRVGYGATINMPLPIDPGAGGWLNGDNTRPGLYQFLFRSSFSATQLSGAFRPYVTEQGSMGSTIISQVAAGTGFHSAGGLEINPVVASGSVVGKKLGLAIVLNSDDYERGLRTNQAITIGRSGAATLVEGIVFGDKYANYPFSTDGTLIAARARAYSGTSSVLFNYGVDYREAFGGITTGAFASPHFLVDGIGGVHANGVVTSGTVQAQTAVLGNVTVDDGGIYTGNVFPTLFIDPPPAGGTTASATVATMGGRQVLAFGTTGRGYTNGETGTPVGGLGVPPTWVLTTDGSGSVTSMALNSAAANAVFTGYITSSTILTVVSAISGTGGIVVNAALTGQDVTATGTPALITGLGTGTGSVGTYVISGARTATIGSAAAPVRMTAWNSWKQAPQNPINITGGTSGATSAWINVTDWEFSTGAFVPISWEPAATGWGNTTASVLTVVGDTGTPVKIAAQAVTSDGGLLMNAASVKGTITGTNFTVSSVISGIITVGQAVTGPGVTANTRVASGSGVSWTLTQPSTISTVTTVHFNSVPSIDTVGSLTAIAAGTYHTTTAGNASVQMGYSILTTAISAVGSGYVGGAIPTMRTTQTLYFMADLVPVMTTVAAPLPLNPGGGLVTINNSPADSEIFGFGFDGALAQSSGLLTMTRDMHYTTVVVSGTGSIDPNGFVLYARDSLDISNAPAGGIQRNGAAGGNASAATAGAVASTVRGITTLSNAQGAAGKAGGTGAGIAGAASLTYGYGYGGDGAATGAGGAGGSAGGSSAAAAVITNRITSPSVLPLPLSISFSAGASQTLATTPSAGGSAGGAGGGDGTNSGGGSGAGGNGGGAVIIRARTLIRGASTAVGAIQAKGGNGGNGGTPLVGNTGGGAGASGGGGGLIDIVVGALSGSTATGALDVGGGTGGAGGNGHGTGIGGGGGSGGSDGLAQLKVLSGPTFVVNSPNTAGSAGSTTVTITGGAGGAGAVRQINL